MVLITDGYDEHSRHTFETTLASLKASQVTVYVVGVGGVAGVSLKGEQLLRQIAAETGGRAYFPWNAKELAEAHAAIAADVQHRYRLAYTPTNQRKDGTWRVITLSATNPSYKVRARPGYEALHPPPVRASVEFTATDQARQYIDLAREDLEVIEDGVAQQVDVFHEAVAPVAIVLAVDASGSMTRAAEIARQAAAHFVDAVRPGDPLAVVQFADKAELVADLQVARDEAHAALANYTPKGGTALYDALQLSMQRLKSHRRPPRRRRRDRRPGRERGLDRSRQRRDVGDGDRCGAGHGRDGLRDRSRLPRRTRAAAAAGRPDRRRSVLHRRSRHSGRGVSPGGGGSPPPIRAGVHIHQREARRRLAAC